VCGRNGRPKPTPPPPPPPPRHTYTDTTTARSHSLTKYAPHPHPTHPNMHNDLCIALQSSYELEAIASKYIGKEHRLYQSLEEKYGENPVKIYAQEHSSYPYKQAGGSLSSSSPSSSSSSSSWASSFPGRVPSSLPPPLSVAPAHRTRA
jgi:hypothetical protein